MSFAELPVELLEMICVHCSLDQIKALRLTCQSLRNVADDYLFPEIVTVMTRASMEAARQIAEHPKFCKQPTVLCFQGDRSHHLGFEEWKLELKQQIELQAHISEANRSLIEELGNVSMAQDREPEVNPELEARSKELIRRIQEGANAQPKPTYSENQLRDHFNHYSGQVFEGIRIVADGTVQRCMRAVFQKCTNVRAFDFTTANTLRPGTHKKNKTFSKGLVTPFGDCDQHEEGLDSMAAVILAAVDAGFSPHTLRLGSVTSHLVNHPALSGAIPHFMANVETLHWTMSTPYLEDCTEVDTEAFGEIMAGFLEGHFIDFMQSAVNLRSLEFDMPCVNPGDPKIDLAGVVGSVSWTHLQSFAITTVYTESTDLVGFMLRHADTLERLELNEVSLHEEWPACFAEFAGKLPRLKEVQLRGVFEDNVVDFFCYFGDLYASRGNEYSQQVAQYIIEGGEEFPMPPTVREDDSLGSGSEDDPASDMANE